MYLELRYGRCEDVPSLEDQDYQVFRGIQYEAAVPQLGCNAIPKDGYTYIHFAFAGITPEYHVNVSDIQEQFDKFKELPPPARVLAFGGWSFSTSQDTYPIFRQGVTEGQRETFADNVVQFLIDNALDGLDFDWEYPSAPDIPGIPSGSPSGGED
jgi:chitinase